MHGTSEAFNDIIFADGIFGELNELDVGPRRAADVVAQLESFALATAAVDDDEPYRSVGIIPDEEGVETAVGGGFATVNPAGETGVGEEVDSHSRRRSAATAAHFVLRAGRIHDQIDGGGVESAGSVAKDDYLGGIAFAGDVAGGDVDGVVTVVADLDGGKGAIIIGACAADAGTAGSIGVHVNVDAGFDGTAGAHNFIWSAGWVIDELDQ